MKLPTSLQDLKPRTQLEIQAFLLVWMLMLSYLPFLNQGLYQAWRLDLLEMLLLSLAVINLSLQGLKSLLEALASRPILKPLLWLLANGLLTGVAVMIWFVMWMINNTPVSA